MTGLADVSITLLNSDEHATTDEKGQFSFSAALPIDAGHSRHNNPDLLKWRGAEHLFDLQSAPGLTSIALYNLKGKRLFFKERTPGSDLLLLPDLPRNLYLLRIGKIDGKFDTFKWVDRGSNAVFILGISSVSGGSLQKRVVIVDSLIFNKEEYQTKKITVDNDSASWGSVKSLYR